MDNTQDNSCIVCGCPVLSCECIKKTPLGVWKLTWTDSQYTLIVVAEDKYEAIERGRRHYLAGKMGLKVVQANTPFVFALLA